MKFFHLSDLHIGKQLHFYSLRKDQEAVFEEIVRYAEELKPEAIVIAGDVYDKSVPSAEAVAVFDGFVRKLADTGTEILVISGNHDSPERLEFASSLLERQHLHIAGLPPLGPDDYMKQVILQDSFGKVHFYLLPFLKPGYVRSVFPKEEISSYTQAVKRLVEREALDPGERNVLVTHQFYTAAGIEPEQGGSEAIFVGGTGNVDISAAAGFDYVAMGHIHKKQSVGNRQFRYCGTPLKYSAGESRDEKSLTVVTLGEKGTAPVIEEFPLHPLYDVRQMTGTLEELLEKGCEDYVSLVLTDEKMPYQARERLDAVFPRLLELRIENGRTRRQLREIQEAELLKSPEELFEKFYEDIHGQSMSEREREIIREIIEKAEEGMR